MELQQKRFFLLFLFTFAIYIICNYFPVLQIATKKYLDPSVILLPSASSRILFQLGVLNAFLISIAAITYIMFFLLQVSAKSSTRHTASAVLFFFLNPHGFIWIYMEFMWVEAYTSLDQDLKRVLPDFTEC